MQNVVQFRLHPRDERTLFIEALKAARELPVALAVLQFAKPGSAIHTAAEEHIAEVLMLVRDALDRAEGR